MGGAIVDKLNCGVQGSGINLDVMYIITFFVLFFKNSGTTFDRGN